MSKVENRGSGYSECEWQGAPRPDRRSNNVVASMIPAEKEYLQTLRRKGKLLNLQVAGGQTELAAWRCFLLLRERNADAVRSLCEALPLASYLSF